MPTTFHEIPEQRPITPLLDRALTPTELRSLSEAELVTLADELRLFLLWSVGQTGGHFAAGLGVIELTIALHYVFDTPDDRLVWDVGHQAIHIKSSPVVVSRCSVSARKMALLPFRAVVKANTTPLAWGTQALQSVPL